MLYADLQARGYQVSVGKIGKLECDFITRKANDHAYMQVAFSIAERSVGGSGNTGLSRAPVMPTSSFSLPWIHSCSAATACCTSIFWTSWHRAWGSRMPEQEVLLSITVGNVNHHKKNHP